ncbi:hypothetical protein DPMN_118477 [Dreissena polymorpha]|uniref:Uncharacterized protein n=1 Tax=Dreissena polymorpha TaxID=45954 RepID=A0A9D4JR44_DREPO|nr:hypothetical protein DPMN_118477 [Dreissena polymorpha]
MMIRFEDNDYGESGDYDIGDESICGNDDDVCVYLLDIACGGDSLGGDCRPGGHDDCVNI